MLTDKRFGYTPATPGISGEIAGAPTGIPGGNDGRNKAKMNGTVPEHAYMPAPASPDLAGAPGATSRVSATPKVSPTATTHSEDKGYTGEESAQTTSASQPERHTGQTSTTTQPGTSQTPPAQTGVAKKDAWKAFSPEEDASYAAEMEAAKKGYDGIIDLLEKRRSAFTPLTEEELKKLRRRQKAEAALSGISDAVQSVANLVYTTRYAPDMFDPDDGMSVRAKARFEREKAEREKKDEEYYNLSQRIGALGIERGKALREMAAERERQRLARGKDHRDELRFGWEESLQPDIQREHKGKADKAGYDAQTAQYEAENTPTRLKLENNTERARANNQNAAAKAHNASAANSYASAADHNYRGHRAWDKHGNERWFKTADEAENFARQEGTLGYTPQTETSTSTTGDGFTTRTTNTKKTKQTAYPARPKKKASPTSGGKKKSPTGAKK